MSDIEVELPLLPKGPEDNVPIRRRRREGAFYAVKDKLRAIVNLFSISNSNQRKARVINLPDNSNNKNKYSPNIVRNQKYSLLTFFPVVLYEQFKFFMNLYFLLVALSQIFPVLRIGYLITFYGPLSCVLAVTISKEAYDDIQRHKRDKEINNQIYQKLTKDGLVDIPSSKIKVGDLIKINCNQRIPTDMVLLRTSEKTGSCFIRTDQLDGETDWKLRLAVPITQKLPSDESLAYMNAQVYAEKPQKDIHKFVGTFTYFPENPEEMETTIPLEVENTLWANCVVAQGTSIGLVIYTGKDNRSVMNISKPNTKVGSVDWEINRLTKILMVITLLLSFILVALNQFRGLWYVSFFRFMIIFSSIIPISLRINLDLAKTYYSYEIEHDKEIPGTMVRTSTIPEELGRVEYLLSDKTGTLTKNEMILKRVHLGRVSYSFDTFNEIKEQLIQYYTLNKDEKVAYKFKQLKNMTSRIHDVVISLALCHNVSPIISEDGKITYQASSPDEIAILKWCESVGITLIYRDIGSMRLQLPDPLNKNNNTIEYEILEIFPFTSETKRMGIIVRNVKNRKIVFYMKGADVVMSKIVQYNDWLDEECGNMAREGLRTLVIGKKKLSEQFYEKFMKEYNSAKININNRNEAMQSVVTKYLENDLELLGITGVEDKLQDDVSSTLELLRNAGINIWMLTGDKVETACCIGISSRLISRNQSYTVMAKLIDRNEIRDKLELLEASNDSCLVIDGETLKNCLMFERELFISVALKLPTVICCRCSPTQKAEITKLIKEYTKSIVCAIGDGGNDVSMIQAADVGVGIVGKEGKQASLAADFSINQFSYLTELLLWHGRNSYKRSAILSQFIIHRGLIISFIQFVFSAMFYFAPIALYQGLLLVGYATFFTSGPIFSLVLNQDVSRDVAKLYPELYKELLKGRSLSLKTFCQWVLTSVYQGGAIMVMAIILFEDQFINIVSITFTSLILNELCMVLLEVHRWKKFIIYAQLFTIIFYIGSMFYLKTDFDVNFIVTIDFLWKVLAITSVSYIPLFVVKTLRKCIHPSTYSRVMN